MSFKILEKLNIEGRGLVWVCEGFTKETAPKKGEFINDINQLYGWNDLYVIQDIEMKFGANGPDYSILGLVVKKWEITETSNQKLIEGVVHISETPIIKPKEINLDFNEWL